jgi:hypothetical protein
MSKERFQQLRPYYKEKTTERSLSGSFRIHNNDNGNERILYSPTQTGDTRYTDTSINRVQFKRNTVHAQLV